MKAILNRFLDNGVQTLGELVILEDTNIIFRCKTLELPWKKNARKVSCIPKGTYKVVKRTSTKYKKHFHVTNVVNRDAILIHHGNYFTDILGCILVGEAHTDINKDGQLDVSSSKNTMSFLNTIVPAHFDLEIK